MRRARCVETTEWPVNGLRPSKARKRAASRENEILACWMARRAAELAPDDAAILNPNARVLTLLGRADEAERLVSAALERHPDNQDLQLVMANIRAHADNTDTEPQPSPRHELRLISAFPVENEEP